MEAGSTPPAQAMGDPLATAIRISSLKGDVTLDGVGQFDCHIWWTEQSEPAATVDCPEGYLAELDSNAIRTEIARFGDVAVGLHQAHGEATPPSGLPTLPDMGLLKATARAACRQWQADRAQARTETPAQAETTPGA